MANLFNIVVCCLMFVVFLTGCGDTDTTVAGVVVTPSAKTLGINKTQEFTAYPKNSLGQIVSTSITWSISGSGSISTKGIYTAGSASGEAKIYAAVSTGVSGEASVTVTEKGWVSGTVYDSKGYKVNGLKVYLQGYISSLFDSTDSSGKYSISNVPYGTYEVLTEQTQAYRSASDETFVASGETTTINFTILYFTDPPDFTPPEFPSSLSGSI